MSKTKPNGKDPPAPEQGLTFEQSLAALEQCVRRLEDGELDLAGALTAFESGIRHLKCCYARLEEAERRIELLCGVDRDGQAQVRSFTDDGMSLEEKQQARSRRRSHSASSDGSAMGNIDGDGRLF